MVEKGDVYKTDSQDYVLVFLNSTGVPLRHFLYYPTAVVLRNVDTDRALFRECYANRIVIPPGVICPEQSVLLNDKKWVWVTHPTPGYFLQKMDQKYLPLFGWKENAYYPHGTTARKWLEGVHI
jgi:hypothetical protein